jgi:hypothetical protein
MTPLMYINCRQNFYWALVPVNGKVTPGDSMDLVHLFFGPAGMGSDDYS